MVSLTDAALIVWLVSSTTCLCTDFPEFFEEEEEEELTNGYLNLSKEPLQVADSSENTEAKWTTPLSSCLLLRTWSAGHTTQQVHPNLPGVALQALQSNTASGVAHTTGGFGSGKAIALAPNNG